MGYSITTLFLIYSQQFGLPPNLLSSLCYVESGHRVEQIHYNDGQGNSIGICQIKLKTARALGYKGTEENLLQPTINIYYAAAYLKHQIDRYDGSLERGVIAYNMGHAGRLTSSRYQAKVYEVWGDNINE